VPDVKARSKSRGDYAEYGYKEIKGDPIISENGSYITRSDSNITSRQALSRRAFRWW